MEFISRIAASVVVPGFTRAIADMKCAPRFSGSVIHASSTNGSQRSGLEGNVIDGGATPITVKSSPLTEIARPMMDLSALKLARHNRSERTTTRCAPLRSSPARNPRPSCIGAPRRSKNFAPTLGGAETLRFRSGDGEVGAVLLLNLRHSDEASRLVAIVDEVGGGHVHELALFAHRSDADERVGFAEGQRLEQHTVDDAEHGGRRTDRRGPAWRWR
jgi:hypothetical protein